MTGVTAEAVTPGVRTRRALATARSSSWRGLIIQPVAILVVLAGFALWLSLAPLTETERTTLAPDALWRATVQHISLTFVSAAIVLAVAIPFGVLLTRRRFRRLSLPILAVANFGQAAPAIGLVVLLAIFITSGYWASILALVLYAALPVLRRAP